MKLSLAKTILFMYLSNNYLFITCISPHYHVGEEEEETNQTPRLDGYVQA